MIPSFICLSGNGQVDSGHSDQKYKTYFGSYFTTGLGLLKFPANFSKEDWFQFGGSVAVTAALIPMDEVINIPFEGWTSPTANAFGKTGDFIGGVPFQFGLTAASLGIGYATKNKKWQHFGLDNLQAQVFTGGITFIFKELFHRARPETGEGNYAWYGPFNGKGNTSFFSGHTSLSFATATMIYLHSDKKWWVGLISYSVASGVGISRMQQQKHWASDVVGGALVGTAVAKFVYNQQEKRRLAGKKLKELPENLSKPEN